METNRMSREISVESRKDSKLENDSKELVLKHPLQNHWQLWYLRPDKDKDWEENLLNVSDFNTIEDFWAHYNNLEFPSNLKFGSDYSIFKDGITPMWEDKHNKAGGRWLFTFTKTSPKVVDHVWLEVLLCLIGEAFGEDSDQVCGAVINIRPKMDKISIWTNDYSKKDSIINIGKILKSRTGYNELISYERHIDTIVKTRSFAKPMITL